MKSPLKSYRLWLILIPVLTFGVIFLIQAGDFRPKPDPNYQPRPLLFPEEKQHKGTWKKIDSLENKGLYRSALPLVDSIYNVSQKDRNAEQQYKALLYKLKFLNRIEEESEITIIDSLSNISANSYFPLNSILHSLTAEAYWNYYQRHRRQIMDRTRVRGREGSIKTWDAWKLENAIIESYNNSLKNKDSLKRTPVDQFTEIIKEGERREARPTLYDLLGHRTVDMLRKVSSELPEPIEAFKINDPSFLDPADQFVQKKLSTQDTLSHEFHALKILQDLTLIHLDPLDTLPLVHTELKRLQFVHGNGIFPKKDSLFVNALKNLQDKVEGHPAEGEVMHTLALHYKKKGLDYQPGGPENIRWKKKESLAICEQVIEKYPESYGAHLCKSLKAYLNSSDLGFQMELSNTPNQPIRSLVSYQNVDTLYFRVVELNPENALKHPYSYNRNEDLSSVVSKSPIKEWQLVLPDSGDLQTHRVEISIPKLSKGYYAILAASSSDFSTEEEAVAMNKAWVTNLSFVQRQTEDYTYHMKVLDRKSGKPAKNVDITLHERIYDRSARKYVYKEFKTVTTDSEGEITLDKPEKRSRSLIPELKKGEDHFIPTQQFYQSSYYRQEKRSIRTDYFTDRSIYRPGQTIHFKGLVTEKANSKAQPKIKPNHSTKVTFYDVNHEKIAEKSVTTNEFGSFHGTFTAPSGALTGRMQIRSPHGHTNIRVEEYKRPKFQVELDPIEGNYKLGEEVTVTGKAETFAGADLSEPKVEYRVYRKASFPYWSFRWNYIPNTSEKEVAYGSLKGDEDGKFEFDFTAIPDHSMPKKWKPLFTYGIEVEVTDINGESHSANKRVHAGYHAMNLDLGIGQDLEVHKADTFTIKTTNLNGEPLSAKGTITIHKLKEPDRLLRERLWSQPDYFLMSEDTFRSKFPRDPYGKELNKNQWERKGVVLEKEFESEKGKAPIEFENITEWEQGTYVAEAKTKDAFGKEVKREHYFRVFDRTAQEAGQKQALFLTPLKRKGEPGEKASFLIGSAGKDVQVWYEIEHKGKITSSEWIKLDESQQVVSIPIKEKHRGNFTAHFTAINNGRIHKFDPTIQVPYSNKDLNLEFETFRNKLKPGEEEKWRIHISGHKKEKVAAEMMATLYDASLDQIHQHNWGFSPFRYFYSELPWRGYASISSQTSKLYQQQWNQYYAGPSTSYDELKTFGLRLNHPYRYRFYDRVRSKSGAVAMSDEKVAAPREPRGEAEQTVVREEMAVEDSESTDKSDLDKKAKGGATPNRQGKGSTRKEQTNLDQVALRKNFQETAFFYPDLKTDENGDLIIEFTIPEALTEWKLMALAHTKELEYEQIEKSLKTQKDLMVMPNAPRFFREGDKISFPVKIDNLSEKDLEGKAQVKFFDALAMEPVDAKLANTNKQQAFKVEKEGSTVLYWDLEIPEGLSAITYRVSASAGNFSDGQEDALPVLTNRKLVTETKPLPIRKAGTKTFSMDKLLNSGKSSTLKHHRLTFEYTANPAWYAVQALPYMMEYPHECTEQVFSRYYANSIAHHLVTTNPKVERVLENWKQKSPDAFLSNLQKNEELKSVILEETPWVMEAKEESERKRRIALLFDLNHMKRELSSAMKKLKDAQYSNGGWPWFPGMKDSKYITRHIIAGLGHLKKLGIMEPLKHEDTKRMIKKGLEYLDDRAVEDLERIKQYDENFKENDHLHHNFIHYYYARSFFTEEVPDEQALKVIDYIKEQTQKFWTDKNLYMQGMLALSAKRFDEPSIPSEIMKSVKERAIVDEEMGMYWKDFSGGYYWYQAPIEKHALLIEAFSEVSQDEQAVEDLKVWLIKHKQTNDWGTTKATAEACYALMLQGKDWLAEREADKIQVGKKQVNPEEMEDVDAEAGTGYFKISWSGEEVNPEMGKVTITKSQDGVSWGALYWQYFEDLDKITSHQSPLQIDKRLFLKEKSGSGAELNPISQKTKLKPGDRIVARVTLATDREMEYIHLKDMRASGLEPVKALSGYEYRGGLGYYRSTKDASTNFFIDRLPKGTYTLEYEMKVSQRGNFSNGIATIQCMYAPEFAAHSEGTRVTVTGN